MNCGFPLSVGTVIGRTITKFTIILVDSGYHMTSSFAFYCTQEWTFFFHFHFPVSHKEKSASFWPMLQQQQHLPLVFHMQTFGERKKGLNSLLLTLQWALFIGFL